MKKIFYTLIIAASSFGIVNAQNAVVTQNPTPSHGASPQSMAKRMVSKVNVVCHLHGDQFGKVNDAYTNYFVKFEALANQHLSKEKLAEQDAILKSNRDAALKASLEPAQWQQWLADQQGK